MKAKDIAIGSRVKECYPHDITAQQIQNRRTGIVVSNETRSGDEFIAVEWDENLKISAINVNNVCIFDE